MSAPIPARSWDHDGLLHRQLLLGATHLHDDVITIGVRGRADGITISLSLDQADEVADEIKARVAAARGAA